MEITSATAQELPKTVVTGNGDTYELQAKNAELGYLLTAANESAKADFVGSLFLLNQNVDEDGNVSGYRFCF